MRRIEDEKSARRSERLKRNASKDVDYPTVVLEGFKFLEGELRTDEIGGSTTTKKTKGGGKQKSVGRNELVITREQVDAHLARKGAYTDHFDHPLMYARAHLRQLSINYGDGQVVVDFDGEQEESDDDLEFDDDLDSADETNSEVSSFPSYGSLSAPSLPRRRTRLPLTPASSLESRSLSELLDPRHRPGLVAIAHSILGLTTGVRNLSLTGYFTDCLNARSTNQDRAAVLDELLYLSIGPLLESPNERDCVESVKLAALEELRIVGERISWKTICHFAHQGKKANWPRLKTVQWEFADHWFTLTDTEGL